MSSVTAFALCFSCVIQPTLAGTNPLQEGQDALKNKDYDRAIACFTKVLQTNARHARTLSLRGLAYVEKGLYDKAIADCTAAIRIDPREVSPYLHRSRAYALGKVPGTRDSVSVKVFDSAVIIMTNPAHNHVAAIADCKHVLNIDPKSVDAHYILAEIYRAKGEHDPAIDHLSKAIALDPKGKGYMLRGQAFFAKWRAGVDRVVLKEALADFRAAVKLAPEDWHAYFWRGGAHTCLGESANAHTDFTEALRLRPNEASVLCARGEAFLQAGDCARAFADFNKAIDLKRDDAQVYWVRAWAYESVGLTWLARWSPDARLLTSYGAGGSFATDDPESAKTVGNPVVSFLAATGTASPGKKNGDRTERPKLRVRQVLFLGNRVFTSEELNAQVKPPTNLAAAGYGELETAEFYKARGYLDVRVTPEARFIPDSKLLDIVFRVKEGVRYRIANVRVVAAEPLNSKEIFAKIRSQVGDFYSEPSIKEDSRIIRRYCASRRRDVRVHVEWVYQDQPGRVELIFEVNEAAPSSQAGPR
jgi:tetratricopeptide (TPR) repeat protein